ncbi:MAG: T9SS type A sorting domain-containing protein [Bacteroidia bacterium]|nr:T9SS type A sorting domain-containing protein [Bacteroidia bacterium]
MKIPSNHPFTTLFRIALILFCGTSQIPAQSIQFVRSYGNDPYDYCIDLQLRHDNGYLMCGATHFSHSNWGMYLLNTDANGDFLWAKAYGGLGNESAQRVRELPNGELLIVGQTQDTNSLNSDILVVKLDAQGDVLWSKSYGTTEDDYSLDMALTNDGGAVISGYTYSYTPDMQAFIIRIDSLGNVVWASTFGNTWDRIAYGITPTSDGGFLASAWELTFGRFNLLKLNANGQLLWTKTREEGGATNLIETADHGIIFGGQTYLQDPLQQYHIFATKTDSLGNRIWTNRYRFPLPPHAVDLWPTMAGGIAMLANVPTVDNSLQSVLIEIDGNGNLIHSRQYGGSASDSPYGMVQAPDSGFAMLLGSNSFGALRTILLKSDPIGEVGCIDSTIAMTVESLVIPEYNESITYSMQTVMVSTPNLQQFSDLNAGAIFCTNVSANEPVHDKTRVYPNPSNGSFKMDFPISKGELTIINQNGQVILQRSIDSKTLDLDLDVPSGIYRYTLQNDEGKTQHGNIAILMH